MSIRSQADALFDLEESLTESAQWRGHENLTSETFSPTHSRVTCAECGLDADADTNPPANGIDIGGPLVALNCGDQA